MMFRKTMWRTIDLREKQNKPLFARNQQITKGIMEAVRAGKLPVYKNDSLTATITKSQFFSNLTLLQEEEPLSPEEIELGFTREEDDADWVGIEAASGEQITTGPQEYLPQELFLLELKEDAIVDKKRSRMYYEIKSLTLIVPATLETNLRKRDIPVGTFKYEDLVKVFRQPAIGANWVNPYNDVQQKNMAEALELRLFSSFITKVSNPEDATLEDLNDSPAAGLLASQQAADKLLEYEYNLWSF